MGYKYTTILTLTADEVIQSPIFAGFWDCVSEKLGYYNPQKPDENYQYIFDCRHINIANNIQDACFAHFQAKGFPNEQINMALAMGGPKVDHELKDNQVGIEAAYAQRALTVELQCKKCGKKFKATYCVNGGIEYDNECCYCHEYVPVDKYPTQDEWLNVMKARGKQAVLHFRKNNALAAYNGRRCTIIETAPDGKDQTRRKGLFIQVKFEDNSQLLVRSRNISIDETFDVEEGNLK